MAPYVFTTRRNVENTELVKKSVLIGIYLFLLSEVLVFFALFWYYLNISISPSIYLGAGFYLHLTNLWEWDILTLYITLVLTSSSFFLTWAEMVLKTRPTYFDFMLPFGIVILLAAIFIIAQILEFTYLPFTLRDGALALSFFTLVGLHGLHAIIGLALFLISWVILIINKYN